MPLSKIQIDILRLLASHRNPESYIAGATPLNLNTIRYSSDIDIFHDREELVASAADADAKTLETAGYNLRWSRRFPTIHAAEVSLEEARTRLEWVVDSDFRFFPTMQDDTFGYVLHPVDLAMNKVMAAAGRRAVRDLVDLITIHEHILPLGAVVWATVEKSPGFTPEGLIAEIRRNSNYPTAEWRALESIEPIDSTAAALRLRAILADAEEFVMGMPSERAGLLFLEGGVVIQPQLDRLDTYQTHTGQRRGHWPGSSEISTAMLDRYQTTPPRRD